MKYSLNVFSIKKYSNIKSFLSAFRFARQRITQGFADCDVWEMNTYITSVVAGMLKTLAETDNGYSPEFSSYEEWINELERVSALASVLSEKTFDGAFDDEIREEKEAVFDFIKNHFTELWD
ncbi:MAG: hypothetical protein J5562_06510 [Clostridia bacterium]|nr:hypothetical protein [Clostridia bacterium]